ncbi:2TM domain-containing protein [Gaetbulibacter aestuarii]|uniref:2TM domain-containing protein n=1 Tax=Gaetbulibacter aestuarii TaxID=1502358 RepID=A0ABW7MX56_9FLAO
MEIQDSKFTSKHKSEDAYFRAQKRVKEIKGFYWHLFWYVVVNVFLIYLFTREGNQDFWSFSTFTTAFFWGIGLSFHGLRVFGKNIFFSKSWEQRKMKEFMEKERKNWE